MPSNQNRFKTQLNHMQKHWTKFLPEAGRILEIKAQRIETAMAKMSEQELLLAQMRIEIAQMEIELLEEVKPLWTDNEIKVAKLEAKTQC
jgi:hypothetical protein